ncbi:hypothetical protein Tco_0188570 [Tanacetum coccineum]
MTLKNTPYPHQRYVVYNTLVNKKEQAGFTQYAISIKKIRCIRAYTSQITTKDWRPNTPYPGDINTPDSQYSNKIFWKISNVVLTLRTPQYAVKMDDLNITMEEYIILEEEKARRRAIVYNDTLMSEPTVSSLNNTEIDFLISFDESDDEDYTIIFDKNSFSYKIIYVNDLKMDSENDNEKVNMPSFSSPKPTISYFDDLDFCKDFKNEFPAIVYNVGLTSKFDFLTEPTVSPQHIDEFNLKDETSLSECDEKEQNVIYFNDLFPFNVIYPDDSNMDKDNDDDKIDIEHSSRDMSVIPLSNVININVGAYAHRSNKLLETSHDTSSKFFKTKTFIKELNVNIMTWNHLNKGMSVIFLIKNSYVPFGILFDPKLFNKVGIKLGQV